MQETAKSIIVKKFGSYDALSVEEFLLEPLEGRIEVKVEFGGLNFADLYSRQGLMYDKKLPFVLGLECTGTVTKIGLNSSKFSVGDRVICYDYHGGMHAKTIRIREENCFKLPKSVDFKLGAAIFVNYVTAYFALFNLGNLREKETVLILSCAGGVGFAATQLAKTVSGVKVVGTVSSLAAKGDVVRENGVDETIELDENFEKNITLKFPDKFDLIISNQSGNVFTHLQTCLKPLGRIVLLGANNLIENSGKLSFFKLIKAWLFMKSISLEALLVNNRVVAGLHLGTLIDNQPEIVETVLERIFVYLQNDEIKPRIDAVCGMEDIVKATKLLAERKNIGKVLVTINE